MFLAVNINALVTENSALEFVQILKLTYFDFSFTKVKISYLKFEGKSDE